MAARKDDNGKKLRGLLSELDGDLIMLEQHKPVKANGKLTAKDKGTIRKLDFEWARRDRVYAMYLRGFSPYRISKREKIARSTVWKDITAKKWEIRRMQSGDNLEMARQRLRELYKVEWQRYRKKKISEGERLQHAELIKEILRDMARLDGFDFKDGPKNQFNLFGNNQQLNIVKDPEAMTDDELDADILRETRALKEIKES